MKKLSSIQIVLLGTCAVIGAGGYLLAQDAAPSTAAPTAAATTQPAEQEAAVVRTGPPLFTEDFESGELNRDVWEQRTNLGVTITVEKDDVAHGKNAVLVHYPNAARAYGFFVASHLPDSLKEHFFGRAYVKFPVAPPNAHDVFITGGSAGWPTSNFLEIGLRQNTAQLSYQQNGASVKRGETMIKGPAYPVGKWFCLEWEFNDNPDSIRIWIDGKKVTDAKAGFKGTADHLVKGFVEFGFGFRSWGKVPNGFDVLYDDIALDTARIGPVAE